VSGAVSSPLVRVLAEGVPLPAPVTASVLSNGHFHAGEFSLVFAASSGVGTWWDASPPWVLDVQVSADGIGFTTLITGEVDQIEYDVATGQVLLAGRDFVAAMIEAPTQETFQNRTSSEIAGAIAARHGLAAAVVPTSTLAGTFYQQDHVRNSLGAFARARTEWDLLTWLAQHEGCDVWVQGRTLYFQPLAQPGLPDFTVLVGTDANGVAVANVEQLRCTRALTLAKGAQVDVHSWSSRQQRAFVKTARTGKAGTARRYVVVRPNLAEDQAAAMARNMLEQVGRQERIIEIEMPGETSLTPRSQVAVLGTGSSFDQSYWVDWIHRQVSMAGFRQSLRLKNHSPMPVAQS
jgi:phage protein D